MTASDLSTTSNKIGRVRDNHNTSTEDILAVEEPLEIRLAYLDPHKGPLHKSISITMRTPGDDTALALGFLFSESIIRSTQDVKKVEASSENVILVELNNDVSFDLARLQRNFYTTSSCGVCGKSSLESLSLAGMDAIRDNDLQLNYSAIKSLPDKLRLKQTMFSLTGGNHATATFNSSGEILHVTEDVGRHNAMDKLAGHLLQNNVIPLAKTGIIVSGRASFELLQKALVAGCQILVAVGAPSSLAVELAQEFNISLAGFTSTAGFNIYHDDGRFIPDQTG